MARYRVFLGAPRVADIGTSHKFSPSSKWQTVADTRNSSPEIEDVSGRISRLYENVIFHDDSEEYLSEERDSMEASHAIELGAGSLF